MDHSSLLAIDFSVQALNAPLQLRLLARLINRALRQVSFSSSRSLHDYFYAINEYIAMCGSELYKISDLIPSFTYLVDRSEPSQSNASAVGTHILASPGKFLKHEPTVHPPFRCYETLVAKTQWLAGEQR